MAKFARSLLAASLLALLAGGCAVGSAFAIIARVRAMATVQAPVASVLPTWSQNDTLELADTRITFGDEIAGKLHFPPHWALGYGSDGLAQVDYGPVPLQTLEFKSYLHTSSWAASESFEIAPALALASDHVAGATGSVEMGFPALSQLPVTFGVRSVKRAVIGSGTLTLAVTNPLSGPVDLELEIPGLIPASGAAGATMSLAAAGQATTTGALDLARSTVKLDAYGDLPIWLAASIPAQVATASPLIPVTVSIAISPLQLDAITGTFAAQYHLATHSYPINLPEQLPAALSLAAIRVQLHLTNPTDLGGRIVPEIMTSYQGSGSMPLSFVPAEDLPAGEAPFLGLFSPQSSAALSIDENNSNVLALIGHGIDQIAVGGDLLASGFATLTASDSVSESLGLTAPLAFRTLPFGDGTASASIAIQPPVGLSFTPFEGSLLRSTLRQLTLGVTADNGWGIPLDLDLLFSTTRDPYTDAQAVREVVHLGNGPSASSSLVLDPSESQELPSFQALGIRLSSPGSAGKIIRLHASDTLHLRVVAHAAVRVTSQLLTRLTGH